MNMGTVKAYDASITTTSSAKRSPWLGDIIEHARTLYVLKYIGKTKGPRRRHVTSCPLASGPFKWIVFQMVLSGPFKWTSGSCA